MAHYSSKPCDTENCCCRAWRDGCELYVADCEHVINFRAEQTPIGGGETTFYFPKQNELKTGWVIPSTGNWLLRANLYSNNVVLWQEEITEEKRSGCCSFSNRCFTFYQPDEAMYNVREMQLTIESASVGVTYILEPFNFTEGLPITEYAYFSDSPLTSLFLRITARPLAADDFCKSQLRGTFRVDGNWYTLKRENRENSLVLIDIDCITVPSQTSVASGYLLGSGFILEEATFTLNPVT